MTLTLGINISHMSSACLLRNGRLVYALAEERLNRVKSSAAFPRLSIERILHDNGITGGDLDEVAVGTLCERFEPDLAAEEEYRPLIRIAGEASRILPLNLIGGRLPRYLYRTAVGSYRTRETRRKYGSFWLRHGIDPGRIRFYDHHLSHAATAAFLNPWPGEDTLVFTCDGLGDGLSATVSTYRGGELTREVEVSSVHSIGSFYSRVTRLLGLKPWEEENKVMGLAGYVRDGDAEDLRNEFRRFYRTSGRGFENRLGLIGSSLMRFLNKKYGSRRFDRVAWAAQRLAEDLLVEWVRRNIRETGIRRVALAGGVFLNVKVNGAISRLDEVDDLFIFPSAGDESVAVGAALLAHSDSCRERGADPQWDPLGALYLGPSFDEELERLPETLGSRYRVSTPEKINQAVAELLAEGEIVARFAGRLEFGPRALGNRSILADPSRVETMNRVNRMIKMRDFWMPFAPVILESAAPRYLVNPKNLTSHYMVNAFETTPGAGHHIGAACHPFDRTCRPQILVRDFNPGFHDLLTRFSNIRGIGALLNTSLNLHGMPMAASPRDLAAVLDGSGIRFAAAGGFLVEKREPAPGRTRSASGAAL